MTEADAVEAIMTRWANDWEALHPQAHGHPEYVPYTFDNEMFSSDLSWCRVSVQHTTSEQITLGSAPYRKFERRGMVMIQVWAPFDAGRGRVSELMDDAREVLEGVRLGEINLYAGRTQESPSDGTWHMSTLVIPFRYTTER